MTYSVDFRQKVLEIKKEEKLSFAEASARFKIAKATIVRWSKRITPQMTRNKPATKIDMEALKQDVEKYPDAYQYERAERMGTSQKGIFEALKRLKVTYKKTLNHPRAAPEKRSVFSQQIKAYSQGNRPLVYLDESGFAHDMPRTHGYSLKRRRCLGVQDWGAKGRTAELM
jgi:transposase